MTAKKSYAALARLRKNQGFLPSSVKMTLIKSLVFPYFDYCAGLFLNLSKELVKKLCRCKNAAVRFATGTKIFEHITPDYEANNIMTFIERRDYLSICLLATILRTKEPSYLYNTFSFKSCDGPGTKGASILNLIVPEFKMSCFEYSFSIRVTYLWNELPHNVRATFVRPAFRKILLDFILNHRLRP